MSLPKTVRYLHQARGPKTGGAWNQWVPFLEFDNLKDARQSVLRARKRWPQNKQRIVRETLVREVVR